MSSSIIPQTRRLARVALVAFLGASLSFLAGCSNSDFDLPTLGGRSSGNPNDLVVIAKNFYDCMTEAGIAMTLRENSQGELTVADFTMEGFVMYQWPGGGGGSGTSEEWTEEFDRLQQEFYDSASPYGADNVVKTAVAEPEDQGIHAGGLTWATKNVGAAKPSDYGNYYTWQEAMVVCPAGWRLPTMDEWSTLMRTTGYNLLDNGAWVGDRQLYLPFAGYIISGGRYSRVGEIGNYWTSNEFEDDKRNAINFAIWSEKWSTGGGKDKSYKYPVRCVKDNDLDIDWDDFEDWMWMLL